MLNAFIAQAIALATSFIKSLIIPKILGVDEYAYWQLLIFYTTYSGLAHLGLVDGLYLKLGGKDYRDLDYDTLGSQFWAMLLWNALIILLICMFMQAHVDDPKRLIVFYALGISTIVINGIYFIGYIFQSVNKTWVYSKAIITENILSIILIVALILTRCEKVGIYFLSFIVSKIVSLVQLMVSGKEIVKRHAIPNWRIWREAFGNIKVGVWLLVSNLCGSFIIGSTRQIIDAQWGLTSFGLFSFSVSLINYALLFINQFSMVLYPALKCSDSGGSRMNYEKLRCILSYVLPSGYLVLVPLSLLIRNWLPQYAQSLEYLSFMLPICIFDGKMQLACNTYLKVERKERVLLYVNAGTSLFNVICSLVAASLTRNMNAMIAILILSIVMRSSIADLVLSQFYKIKTLRTLSREVFLTLIYFVTMLTMPDIYAWLTYAMVYAAMLFIGRQEWKPMLRARI